MLYFLCVLLFLVSPCLLLVFQLFMEWIPIKKENVSISLFWGAKENYSLIADILSTRTEIVNWNYKQRQKLLVLAIFLQKVSKKYFTCFKIAKNYPSYLMQCCGKLEKMTPGSADQELAGKLADNIEWGCRGCESQNLCHWFSPKLKSF